MLDHIKLFVKDQTIIRRLQDLPNCEICAPQTNYYYSIAQKSTNKKIRLDFRKGFEGRNLVGFSHLELSISPHYHYNGYKHNGNDLSVKNCIDSVYSILTSLGIKETEFEALEVCNLEFGLNIIPNIDVKVLINGIFYRLNKLFIADKFPHCRKSSDLILRSDKEPKHPKHKHLKAYAKGLQFLDFQNYKVHPNTFRFEVKSKKAQTIKRLGIVSAKDLLRAETYSILAQSILDEWEKVFVINLESTETEFLKNATDLDFWESLLKEKNRNKFSRYKANYYKKLGAKNNLHHQIKMMLIDKNIELLSGANLP